MAETTVSIYKLVGLLHAMAAGQFAVPEFQRGFVWSDKNVLELFDTINRGFPLGTIVAVEFGGNRFKSVPFPRTGFSEPLISTKERTSVYWVVDGVQRISALYHGLQTTPTPLNVQYDLRKQIFYRAGKNDDTVSLPMSALFDTKSMMSFQGTLLRQDDGEVLLNELDAVRRRFYDYSIPVTVIRDLEEEELATVFTRLNTTGIALSRAEIERASRRKTEEKD